MHWSYVFPALTHRYLESLIHWPQGDVRVILKGKSLSTNIGLSSGGLLVKLLSGKCHRKHLMTVLSHYLSQCSPRYMSLYGITRQQWINDPRKNQENMSNFVVSTTFANGLALLSTGLSAATIMIKFSSCIYTRLGLELMKAPLLTLKIQSSSSTILF